MDPNPPPMTPKQGAGVLQWNAGGWFGAMLGSSSWLAAAAVSVASREPTLALILAGCFAAVAALTAMLWRLRDRITPFAAFQSGLAAIGLASTIAIASTQEFGLLPVIDPRFQAHPTQAYWILLAYPIFMATLGLKESFARSRRLDKKSAPIAEV